LCPFLFFGTLGADKLSAYLGRRIAAPFLLAAPGADELVPGAPFGIGKFLKKTFFLIGIEFGKAIGAVVVAGAIGDEGDKTVFAAPGADYLTQDIGLFLGHLLGHRSPPWCRVAVAS
jgi:hypothetical protein